MTHPDLHASARHSQAPSQIFALLGGWIRRACKHLIQCAQLRIISYRQLDFSTRFVTHPAYEAP